VAPGHCPLAEVAGKKISNVVVRRGPAEEVFALWGGPATAERGCGLLEGAPAGSVPLPSGPVRVTLDQWLVDWRLYLGPGP
jgi:hypothetical protein